MDSRRDQRGHLDTAGNREVVFCHACSHEWYREEHGLQCPNCESEATEIIDPEYDPRELNNHHSSASTSPEHHPYRPPYADDPYGDNVSDPDEDDIEEHMASNHGFLFNRSIRDGPDRDHHDPNLEPTIHRFIDMVNSFGPGAEGTTRRDVNFPGGHMHFLEHRRQGAPQPHIHRATFRSGPLGSGSASFTIYSGPFPGHAASPPTMGDGRADPFQEMFASVMRDMPPPAHTQTGGGSPAFLRGLQDILGLLNPANAMAGDAVYSQEALDRIITNLMEVNPQSNAAPPATEEALQKLERKEVNKAMLDGESKVECPICIDDMKEGDQAIYLPCKHWFHEDCVVLWLKEHNTCPICRSAIEKNEPGDNTNRDGGQSGEAGGSGPHHDPHDAHFPFFPGFGPNVSSRNNNDPSSQARQGGFGNRQGVDPFNGSLGHEEFMDAQTRPHSLFGMGRTRPPVSRPPSHGQSRLNEVLRSVSSLQERQRDQEGATSSSYDTSRLQRRNSLSPTSPRAAMPGTPNSRVRQRSPSQGSGRWAASDRESEREREPQRSGGGPLSWFRNRFSSGDSGSGSSRNERRH